MAGGKRGGAPGQPALGGPWNIAAYIRLSREDSEDESLSVINQKKIILEYVERQFGDAGRIADFYVDDGLTGTDYARAEFLRMVRDIEAGVVNCVICKTLSRAFRNYADQGYFLESFFPRHRARFIAIAGPHVDSFESPEAITGFEVPITGLVNDRYAARTSEDVRHTFDMKRRKGEFIGAFAPYGYAKDPADKNHLVIDEEAAGTVRDVFGWFVNGGMSKMGIARRLNELGVPNPTAYKRGQGLRFHSPYSGGNDGLWDAAVIGRMLRNRVYLGHMVQGRQRVISYKVHDRISVPEEQWYVKENTHEPLIAAELFDTAQGVARRGARTANGRREVYALSGYARCAICGRALRRKTSRARVYYFCRTGEKVEDRCTGRAIREDALTRAVLAVIQALARLAEPLDYIPETPSATPGERQINALRGREREAARLRNAATGLYADWKNGDIAKEEYDFMRGRFAAQLERLSQNIAALEAVATAMADGQGRTGRMPREGLPDMLSVERLSRSLLVALVEAVLVHAHQGVTVRLRCGDPYVRWKGCLSAQ